MHFPQCLAYMLLSCLGLLTELINYRCQLWHALLAALTLINQLCLTLYLIPSIMTKLYRIPIETVNEFINHGELV